MKSSCRYRQFSADAAYILQEQMPVIYKEMRVGDAVRCTLRMIERPHDSLYAGIRVVPRVIARPFFGDEFFYAQTRAEEICR